MVSTTISSFQAMKWYAVVCLTALTMAALGAAKAKFTNQNMASSALYMLLNGSLAAASAYLVSFAISKALDVNV